MEKDFMVALLVTLCFSCKTFVFQPWQYFVFDILIMITSIIILSNLKSNFGLELDSNFLQTLKWTTHYSYMNISIFSILLMQHCPVSIFLRAMFFSEGINLLASGTLLLNSCDTLSYGNRRSWFGMKNMALSYTCSYWSHCQGKYQLTIFRENNLRKKSQIHSNSL